LSLRCKTGRENGCRRDAPAAIRRTRKIAAGESVNSLRVIVRSPLEGGLRFGAG